MDNDLISRSALLEKSEYFSCYNSDCDEIECEFPYIDIDDVKNAPAVDAVAVVRCWDCCRGLRCVDGYVHCKHPSGKAILMTSSDFCSYGERRDDDATD